MKKTLLTFSLSLLCFNSFAAQPKIDLKKEKKDSRAISSFLAKTKPSDSSAQKPAKQDLFFKEALRGQLTSKNHMKI